MDASPELASLQGPPWTRDKEDRLIGLYSQLALLWDHGHPHYYKRDKRDHAMRAIAAAFNDEFDVRSVKDKIKSLRDYFVRELKKEQLAARSSPPVRYVSGWVHFHAWHFLRRVIDTVHVHSHTVNVPQVEVKTEPLDDGGHVFAVEPGQDEMAPPLLPDVQSPATTDEASIPEPSQAFAYQAAAVKEEPCVPESPALSDLTDATATLSPLAKRLRRSSGHERSPPVQVNDKPNVSPSPAQGGHSSVTSAADNKGLLGGAADSGVSAGTGNSGCADGPTVLSNGLHIALFCAQIILELRAMVNVQRDFAKQRLMQILSDVKHRA